MRLIERRDGKEYTLVVTTNSASGKIRQYLREVGIHLSMDYRSARNFNEYFMEHGLPYEVKTERFYSDTRPRTDMGNSEAKFWENHRDTILTSSEQDELFNIRQSNMRYGWREESYEEGIKEVKDFFGCK